MVHEIAVQRRLRVYTHKGIISPGICLDEYETLKRSGGPGRPTARNVEFEEVEI